MYYIHSSGVPGICLLTISSGKLLVNNGVPRRGTYLISSWPITTLLCNWWFCNVSFLKPYYVAWFWDLVTLRIVGSMTFLFHMGSLFGETGGEIYANSYIVIFKQLYAKWWCLHRSIWMVVAKCRSSIMWTSPYCSIGININRTPRSCLLNRNRFVP